MITQEISPSMIRLMDPSHTLTQTYDGDIICFQIDISDEEVHNLESQGLCSNPQQFYSFLQNQATQLDKWKKSPVTAGSPQDVQVNVTSGD